MPLQVLDDLHPAAPSKSTDMPTDEEEEKVTVAALKQRIVLLYAASPGRQPGGESMRGRENERKKAGKIQTRVSP